MRIVALLTMRNEELYIGRCLEHLIAQGIEVCVLDNGSSDRSRAIAEAFLGRGVCRMAHIPYDGFFDLVGQLRAKGQLSSEIQADWFIHQDADEILEGPDSQVTLRDSILAADTGGYNAINFDEFVFVPTSDDESFEGTDYVSTMQNYYFFAPSETRLVRAWKKCADLDLVSSGGHRPAFSDQHLLPTSFVLRHYIGLSADYIFRKYARRIYSAPEVHERGWHGWRAEFANWDVALPSAERLKLYRGRALWDRSDPQKEHQFIVRRRD